WLAVVSATVGVVLMQQPRFLEGNFASLVALASSLCTAIAMIALNRLQGIDSRAIIVHFSAVAVLVCMACYFPLALGGDTATSIPAVFTENAAQTGGKMLVVFLLLGVGVMALVAQFGITKAFTTGIAAKVSVVNLTQVVFAIIFDKFCFGHPIDLVSFLGMSLILVPTAWLMMERTRDQTEGKPVMIGAKQ
ncbi:MAG TPA: hypothetical protein VH682_13080, partial [Gemmataceae bacterium]